MIKSDLCIPPLMRATQVIVNIQNFVVLQLFCKTIIHFIFFIIIIKNVMLLNIVIQFLKTLQLEYKMEAHARIKEISALHKNLCIAVMDFCYLLKYCFKLCYFNGHSLSFVNDIFSLVIINAIDKLRIPF